MLTNAIATLTDEEKPIIHSDRGTHYPWPEWMKIVEKAGFIRSMPRKGCSSDNVTCQGFLVDLKINSFTIVIGTMFLYRK